MVRGALTPAVFLLLFHPAFSTAQTLTVGERLGGQEVRGVATDPSGNVWAVGSATFNAIATTSDAIQPAKNGGGDAFLMRVRPDGSVAYATYLGGSGYDWGYAIAVDTAGYVYVAGRTQSTDFPVTSGAFQTTGSGDDAFVTKLSPDGRSILYSTYIGGSNMDEARGIAVGSDGRVHVIGNTSSTNFPTTGGAVRTAAAGQDVFYFRLSASGIAEFSTLIGGSGSDTAGGIAVDASGSAYLTGYTQSSDFTVARALKSTFPTTAGSQGFLSRFVPAGLDFSTLVGGSNSDQAYGVAVSSSGVYVGGLACSTDFPGAPRPYSGGCGGAAFVSKFLLDGSALRGTVLLDGSSYDDRAVSIAVDGGDTVYAAGFTNSTDFPTTTNAQQVAPAGNDDAFFATVAMSDDAPYKATYVTYLGGTADDGALAISADHAGGAWLGGWTNSTAAFHSVPGTADTPNGLVAHYGPSTAPPPVSDDIVLYTSDAAPIVGNWRLASDLTAAVGVRIENPDAGAAKISSAAANPANYFELTFDAQAGVPYHLWLRMKAQSDSWTNDSVFVQFSDSNDIFGNPAWRVGTTSATVVSLEDCTGCGEHGWGWNDNGYDTPGPLITFTSSGTHTIRIQQREDGISIDQVVLSSRTYENTAPGANQDDTTILPQTTAAPPPPPPDPNEVVMYAGDAPAPAGTFQIVADTTAAGGTRLWNPDAGVGKLASASATPANYVDITFDAQAGVPYRLWLRMKADRDSWQNDSVFVQFSDSVDNSGDPIWRIGSTSATIVSLEDCSGCGEQGWGWNDNGYDIAGTPVVFATSGPHTIRIQQREDGISIDQVVLSAVKYVSAAPGAAKNDATIVTR